MRDKRHSVSYVPGGTAASSFHVSDTVDWSSQSAQTKNRVVITEVRVSRPVVAAAHKEAASNGQSHSVEVFHDPAKDGPTKASSTAQRDSYALK